MQLSTSLSKWVVLVVLFLADDYDPTNLVIPLKAPPDTADEPAHGYYVMRKGVDTWGYGIRSAAELNKLQRDTSTKLDIASLVYPPYTVQRFK